MNKPNHARAFDLPGWPCPPRVRDIPNHENSWGWAPIGFIRPVIVQDDLGYLWADGSAIPRFQALNDDNQSPGAIVFWAEGGLGVYVHRKSQPYIGNLSTLDMEPDRWIPIVVAAAELPSFVKG